VQDKPLRHPPSPASRGEPSSRSGRAGHLLRYPPEGSLMRILKRTAACAAAAFLMMSVAGTLAAQSASILPIVDHIHLNVPDQAKGVEWYQKNFGGQTTNEGPDRLMLGDTRLIFLRNEKGEPSSGSALGHPGFSGSQPAA